MLQHAGRVIPVEAIAEKKVRSRSLAPFIKEHSELKGIRFSMQGYSDRGWMENIPLAALSSWLQPA